jgi:RNA-directed DNA polymerase
MNSFIQRLTGLPVISSHDDLANMMNFERALLAAIIRRPRSFYRRIIISKPSGGERELHVPNRSVKAAQAWILRNILERLQPTPHATAFRKGMSLRSNAVPHANNRYFLTIDLRDFFTHIGVEKIRTLFKRIGYSDSVSYALAQICSNGSYLPQGGVTSPSISNLVAVSLDRRISGLCTKEGLVYTRYADDMTYSANDPSVFRKVMPLIKSIVVSEGFNINSKKTRLAGPHSQCSITSLVKNSAEPTFSVGRRRLRKIRAELFQFKRTGWAPHYSTAASVDGIISFTESISERQGASLRRMMEKKLSFGLNSRMADGDKQVLVPGDL